jgi:FAD/FMN-containing dehydrogenase
VLKRQLEGKQAQAVVRPRSEDEIVRLVALCAKLRVPVTIRGAAPATTARPCRCTAAWCST